MAAFNLDLPVAFLHHGFAIEYAQLVLLQIKIVQPWFQKSRRRPTHGYPQIILRIDLVNFHHSVALVDSYFGIRQTGRNHLHRRIVTDA